MAEVLGDKIVPGAFYWSKQPGGWGDSNTGIHIPGPIVKIDKVTRQIIGVDSMPAPVQLPTHKISFSLQNPKEQIECDFDRYDSEALCEGLNLALQTGNIERAPNELVSELYPKAWEKRRDKIVFKRTAGIAPTKPLGELLNDFMQSRRVRLQAGETTDAQDAAKAAERAQESAKRTTLEQVNSNSALLTETSVSDPTQVQTPPVPPTPPAPPTA